MKTSLQIGRSVLQIMESGFKRRHKFSPIVYKHLTTLLISFTTYIFRESYQGLFTIHPVYTIKIMFITIFIMICEVQFINPLKDQRCESISNLTIRILSHEKVKSKILIVNKLKRVLFTV